MGYHTVGHHGIEPHGPELDVRLAHGPHIGEKSRLVHIDQQALLLHSLQAGQKELQEIMSTDKETFQLQGHSSSTHISHRLHRLNVVHLGGDQFPDCSLNLDLTLAHRAALHEVAPGLVHVLQIGQRVDQIRVLETKAVCPLRYSVPAIAVEQLAQLALLRILDAKNGGPTLLDLFAGCHARLAGLLGGNGGQQSGWRLSGALVTIRKVYVNGSIEIILKSKEKVFKNMP